MKLKTLKDLYDKHQFGVSLGMSSPCVDVFLLRQEVIKWIKYYYEGIKENHSGDPDNIIYSAKIDILMEIFNITEEDLK